ncbi:DUF1493 family protein, partial [Klebsiella aerogenes]|uniref:DUF1493 family protein n=1 Tax=Klebsiella aerogenes TaxID=548 RepID=UPI0013D28203
MLARQIPSRVERLEPGKSLRWDLKVRGDDAVEVFEAISARFDVDMSAVSPHWVDYFGHEADQRTFYETLTVFAT